MRDIALVGPTGLCGVEGDQPVGRLAQHGGVGLAACGQVVGGAIGQGGGDPAVVVAAVRLRGGGVPALRFGGGDQAAGAQLRMRRGFGIVAGVDPVVRPQFVAQQFHALAVRDQGGPVIALGAADAGPGRCALLPRIPIAARRLAQFGLGEVGQRRVVTAVAHQPARQQFAQFQGRRPFPILLCRVRGGLRRGGHVAIHVVLQFRHGEDALGDRGGVFPVEVAAAVQLCERLHVAAALQRQDRRFALDAALRFERLVAPVAIAARAPVLVRREAPGCLRVGLCGTRGVAVAQCHLGAQPPGQAAVAGMREQARGAGVIALAIGQRRQAVGVFHRIARGVLQQAQEARRGQHAAGVGIEGVAVAEQPGDQQPPHRLLSQQRRQFGIAAAGEIGGHLLERTHAGARALCRLHRVQADRAVPVAAGEQQTRLLAEAGDAQLQRIVESGQAQRAGLLEGLPRLLPVRLPLRHGIAGQRAVGGQRQAASQRIGGPRAARPALCLGQGQHLAKVVRGRRIAALRERHRAGGVQAQFRWQVGAVAFGLLRVVQRAQLFDPGEPRGAHLPAFDVVALLRELRAGVPVARQGRRAGAAEAVDRCAQALHFASEAAFG
ncbi:hypothetical protein NB713_003706 [Xanthomonas sacchari]|nr:hypothetical protein [Xanthomonas sacchari]